MADSTPLLPQMSAAADNREIVFNGVVDALSPSSLYGRDYENCTGLQWHYFGGYFNSVDVASGFVTATASNTNYVVAHRTTGVVSISTATTNRDNTTTYLYLAELVAGGSTITSYKDKRQALGVASGTGGSSGFTEEQVQDIVGGLLVAGSGITLNYNDGDSPATLSIAATAGATPLTQENVEDIAAGLVTVGAGLNKQYNDGDSPATLALTLTRAPAIQSVASSATVTPTFSDDIVLITAQAAGLTLANPTGTAIDGLGMVIRIKDNGTARSIGYGTQYRAIGVTLPTTTVISKTVYLALIFNNTDTKWDVLAVGQEA